MKKKLEITLSTEGTGLSAILKDYQSIIVVYLSHMRDRQYPKSRRLQGFDSREVYEAVNKYLKEHPELRDDPSRDSVSRASVINFLNGLVETGALTYGETTGKGGHRRVYRWGVEMTPQMYFFHLFKARIHELFWFGSAPRSKPYKTVEEAISDLAVIQSIWE